jgi:hypothetical protein
LAGHNGYPAFELEPMPVYPDYGENDLVRRSVRRFSRLNDIKHSRRPGYARSPSGSAAMKQAHHFDNISRTVVRGRQHSSEV